MLTQKQLKAFLHYDPKTGRFTRRNCLRLPKHLIGQEAGTLCNGYRYISVQGRVYAAHRLAWLYVYGEWPKGEIDHRVPSKANRSDNRICNLRDVSHATNIRNQHRQNHGTATGVQGVSPVPSGRFVAKIFLDRKQIHLGTFDTIPQAKAAYWAAKKMLHPTVFQL